MRLIDSKKASISLSINAIVVIVIAFVVLGLALTLTRTIFSGALEKIPEALDLTQLEAQPSADNPISFPNTITIKSGGSKTFSLGYYNRWPVTADNAKISIVNCVWEGMASTDDPIATSVLSPQQRVAPSSGKGYKVILTTKEFGTSTNIAPKTYICRAIAYPSSSENEVHDASQGDDVCLPGRDGCKIFEDKQLFLVITA